ncbi:uncharacterized protein LOC117643449 [Thrips palmi]|uniref:Uncharacterized protein LOC117643449 n=1 Tax=Thrips palmi TaxID=161013 RepID=A0A6P8YEV2_THRPL|nr:uncharacterized protein LOC117643449 [Thrips palmi]XP_034238252.1 uncharacterized protein LOC117643449 [Thrips palmi]XP_034238253.1 uncharacterized protein LOC117643449 [Thrips palmi]XP_034238254.1 uncharacterized protein LOC117643449 [Thrips palmi]
MAVKRQILSYLQSCRRLMQIFQGLFLFFVGLVLLVPHDALLPVCGALSVILFLLLVRIISRPSCASTIYHCVTFLLLPFNLVTCWCLYTKIALQTTSKPCPPNMDWFKVLDG